MIQCRLGLPAPFLGGSGWMGKPSGPGGAHVGERAAKPGEILLLATDGVANLPTKGERTLWQTSELRSILMHSGNPHMVIDALARRLPSAKTSLDDALALAVQL